MSVVVWCLLVAGCWLLAVDCFVVVELLLDCCLMRVCVLFVCLRVVCWLRVAGG